MESQLTVAAAYAQAMDHFNAGRYLEADKLCTAIIQAVPNNIDAINLLGVIAQKTNHYDLATEQFKRAINIDNNNVLLYYNLGGSLYQLGRREEAIHVLQTALEKEPGNSQITDYLNGIINSPLPNAEEVLQQGISFHQSNRLDDAIRCYQKVLELQPENTVAISNMGLVLQTNGKLDAAVANYQQAISIKPDFADAYSNLGNALKEQGKIDEAVASYRQAISIKPGLADVHNTLGNILKEQNKLDEAVVCYKKTIALKPDCAEAYSNFGNALKEQGKIDEAVASYREAISKDAWNTAQAYHCSV
jgi:tetratricopeptide (TPR) repeat protein